MRRHLTLSCQSPPPVRSHLTYSQWEPVWAGHRCSMAVSHSCHRSPCFLRDTSQFCITKLQKLRCSFKSLPFPDHFPSCTGSPSGHQETASLMSRVLLKDDPSETVWTVATNQLVEYCLAHCKASMVVHSDNLNTQRRCRRIRSSKLSWATKQVWDHQGYIRLILVGWGLISLHFPFLCSNITRIPNYPFTYNICILFLYS